MLVTLLLLVFAVTALSLGLAFALPGHIELIAVIFVANLPLLFASTALAPIWPSCPPGWAGWRPSIPLPSRSNRSAPPTRDPSTSPAWCWWPPTDPSPPPCLLILAALAAGLFLLIRPLLDRKLA